MNKQVILLSAMVLGTSLVAAPVIGLATGGLRGHVAAVGEAAPSWTLTDTTGASHALKDYAGKYVVLEWTNHQCPYVQKHYRTGNMQATRKFAISHGAVWLSIVSSSKGRAGYVTPEEGQQVSKAEHSLATAELLDPDTTVAREYGAKTTPDMMIINPKGVLIYSGAIDDKPTTDDEDVKTAHNYVIAALKDAFAGRPVQTSVSQPYGCGVKYGGSR